VLERADEVQPLGAEVAWLQRQVRVLGEVAMVQTSVTEERIQDGNDVNGGVAFMDLLEKRAGKWVIVRTLGTRLGTSS
jgi:hypothetical protein